ncbi:MAG TPA: hypothetical protein VLA13_01135 [Massilibacterium sp.]|nr:hypothetical protein [Massilibacterium sp.]
MDITHSKYSIDDDAYGEWKDITDMDYVKLTAETNEEAFKLGKISSAIGASSEINKGVVSVEINLRDALLKLHKLML